MLNFASGLINLLQVILLHFLRTQSFHYLLPEVKYNRRFAFYQGHPTRI